MQTLVNRMEKFMHSLRVLCNKESVVSIKDLGEINTVKTAIQISASTSLWISLNMTVITNTNRYGESGHPWRIPAACVFAVETVLTVNDIELRVRI